MLFFNFRGFRSNLLAILKTGENRPFLERKTINKLITLYRKYSTKTMPDNERKRTFDDPITPRTTKKPNVSASPEDIVMETTESDRLLDEILNETDWSNPESIKRKVAKVKEYNKKISEIATALPHGKSYEEVERHRSLVIAGLPESNETMPSARQKATLMPCKRCWTRLTSKQNRSPPNAWEAERIEMVLRELAYSKS